MARLAVVVALVAALVTGCGAHVVHPPSQVATDPVSGLAFVPESTLDAQEQHTLAEIEHGPPYDYPRNDGVTFYNDEHVLPREPSGFYREFTVVTPGSADRGARRIVAGRDGSDYLTTDHYATFRRIQLSS